MGQLTAHLLARFRRWERSARLAFAIALGLLLVTFLVLVVAPADQRGPLLIGFGGLLVAAQVIFMWGNRYMVTPYTQAQRHYLKENFPAARAVLEALRAAGKADALALTLLANTYRQLGLLDESEEAARQALEQRPSDPFPLYGLGRTLLVKGQYSESAAVFRQALGAGAPPLAKLDLGEALCRQGLVEEAHAALSAADSPPPEPYRELMKVYLLYHMQAHEPPAPQLILAGISYWRDHADRFRHTPYGEALAADVRQMQRWLDEI